MTRLVVKRESLGINTKHTSPSYIDGSDEQVLVSADYGLPSVSPLGANLLEGNVFSTGYTYLNATPLANNATLSIAIAWGSGVEPKIDISGLCHGDAEGYLYEGATVTGGTTLPVIALNRTIASTSNSAVLLNPTITNAGTLLGTYVLSGGQGKKAAGGDVSSVSMIFKPLTTYLLQLKNVSGAAQSAEMRITWYE